MGKKKQLILLVIKLLETESDEKHPITQTAIAKIISEVYPCDRKTVCRNIKFLQEIGYPIVKTTTGFYLQDKLFSVEEINFVKNAILTAVGKNEEEKLVLADQVVDTISKKYNKRF